MELSLPKGTRDFLPEDKIVRDKIVALLKETFELYGYNPLETPALENFETLSNKFAGGSEILKEVYTLEDQGKRKLGLRYDLTVPFARVIAMNQTIKKPFKRYQIDRVWRDGPIKLGRYREFWQCDADVVGIKSMAADAEILSLASAFFKKLDLKVTIFVNNRKLMNSLLDFSLIPKEKQESTILSIDKLKKVGVNAVRKELEENKLSDDSIAKVLSVFEISESSNEKLLNRLDEILENKEGIRELRELLNYAKQFSLDNVKLDISLARGLAYYTSTVLEVFMDDETIKSSLAAGGRFDKMIGNFLGAKDEIPAVGMSFGLDVLTNAIKLSKKSDGKKSVVEVYIAPIKALNESIIILDKLRKAGIKADMDFSSKNITKNLDFADKLKIPYIMIIGEDEIKKNKIKLKNMASGKEEILSVEEIIGRVKNEA